MNPSLSRPARWPLSWPRGGRRYGVGLQGTASGLAGLGAIGAIRLPPYPLHLTPNCTRRYHYVNGLKKGAA